MRHLLIASFIAAHPVAASSAQEVEDEAHRLDRLRTQQLNRQAAAVVDRRDDRGAAREANDARRDYAAARAAYQRRMAEWRARVDACMNGVYEACDQR
ncbi:hypothetical protein [Sphingomonas sp.]|uniref:hypothetical protein n=1 Tax=Sphingomonas sp. TaxID=28214 RepID=UPI000DB8BB6C|nr:hypothetical protein [Sphingomonas sp.]PZU08528.1 MAG: hypothetical protein DI605_11175 [Sphingomonas sp.]